MLLNFNSIFYIIPELFLLSFTLFFLLYGLFFKDFVVSPYFNNLYVFFGLVILFFTFFLFLDQTFVNMQFLNHMYVIDLFTTYIKLFLIVLFFLFFFLSFHYFKFEKSRVWEFPVLILTSLLGMFFLVSSNDFFLVYLSIEFQSFCFYILCAIKKYSNLSVEAALKYFILGSYASVLLLFGISILYISSGTLNFSDFSLILSFLDILSINNILFFLGMILFFVGIFFKLGLFPFHYWVPDVYEGSPLLITLFFSVLTKLSFVILVINLLLSLVHVYSFLVDFFYYCSLGSIIYGTLMSLYQVRVKRLLAYSGISHMGFIILALSCFNFHSFSISLLYLFVYMFLSLNIFAVILSLRKVKNFNYPYTILDFSFFLRSNTCLSFIIALSFLSFSGIPPLAGFFSKFFVLSSLIESGSYSIAVVVVLMSILSSIYYIR